MKVADPEIINGGLPIATPTISIDMFGRAHPFMHASNLYVAPGDGFTGVVLAIGRPEFAGLFMGLSPDQARAVGAWLVGAADAADGGKGKQ